VGSKHFRQLIVWQRADEVRQLVFDATDNFPIRQYKLIDQLQTAALSIAGNIAEGFGRRKPRDKAKFYIIAKASAEELGDYVGFAYQRGFWGDVRVVLSKLDEVGRMLRSLIRKTYDMDG
jgi:four helix bundle protein